MLHHIAGKGHREVIAQALLADLGGQVQRVVGRQQVVGGVLEVVAAVEDFEQQFVSLFAILAHQCGQVLDGGSLYLLKAIEQENVFNCIEYIVTARHLDGREVARPLGDRWFLCHLNYLFLVFGFKLLVFVDQRRRPPKKMAA